MFEWHQRDMRQGRLVDLFPLRPQLVDNVGDFERIPVQDRMGHQAQAARLVQDFLVISRREFALIGLPGAIRGNGRDGTMRRNEDCNLLKTRILLELPP